MNKKYTFPLLLLLAWFVLPGLRAQEVALKTNLLHDATTTLNLGLEVGLTKKWTIDLSGDLNPWTFGDNRKWKHWLAQGEARYWLCERFYGHFFGIHAGGGEFNISRLSFPWPQIDKNYRYEGQAIMAGISYGYAWILGQRWNLEATIGFGVVHADYKRFDCPHCGTYQEKSKKTFFSPTRAGISLIYIIK